MGKTVPSYRMTIEDEISNWKAFVNSLCEKDREAFEVLIGACRDYAMEARCLLKSMVSGWN